MSLYAFYSNVSKSVLVRSAVHSWWEKMNNNMNPSTLLNAIKGKVQSEWCGLKAQCSDKEIDITFENFKKEVIMDLLRKGISEQDVEFITSIKQ